MIGVIQRNEIRLPYPHPGQIAVRRQARRHNWGAMGRRWRKTTNAMAISVEAAMNGERVLWGAPTYDQVRVGWDETKRAAGGIFDFQQVRMTAESPTGGAIIYRSLDNPDNARGHTADGVVMDEAPFIKPASWYEVLRPMLIDTGGWSWGQGTPNGRNWFFRECMAARDRDDSMFWQIPTVGCKVIDGVLVRKPHPLENPFIPFEEIQQIFARTPQRIFEQEILAEFLEGEGAVFRNINACMGATESQPLDHAGHRIVAGVDWGKQADFTAISIGCAPCKKELVLDRFNRIDYTFQRGRLATAITKWRVTHVLAETNAMGEPNLEMLQGEGLPVAGFTTTSTTKPPLIQNLALTLERGEFQFLPDPVAKGELEAYEQKVSPTTGRSQYSAPAGMHDDTVIARALMIWAMTNASPFVATQPQQHSRWETGEAGANGSRWRY